MEGRGHEDAAAVRRSGAFSGRQVTLEMGKVRVGGSGRPIPAVFSTSAPKRAVTSSLEAPSAARSPRVTLEPHPRSPFRRKEEFSQEDVVAITSKEMEVQSNSEKPRPSGCGHGRNTMTLPTASAGAGTFVSNMSSLTKLQCSFTARELELFTHRLQTTESEGNTRPRYHVASHPHSTAAATSTQLCQAHAGNIERDTTQKRSLLSPACRHNSGSFMSNTHREVESSWKQVDTSIDHIYEDPSIDLVQLHLLHSHHTASGQKKRKMVERQRVLAAASGLRQHQSEEQQRQEQLQQRKLQLQRMSEAIRLQNQRAVRVRAARSAGLNERPLKPNRPTKSAPMLPERKPPVPRLSHNSNSSRQIRPKRKSKPKNEASRPQGGVSTSILMDMPLDSNVTTNQQEAESDAKDASSDQETTKPLAEEVKRIPPATTPRASKKKRGGTTHSPEVDAATQAREERRAIAREYMQLQKQSRRIWSKKAKEQAHHEQEKRQQKLEILEATRLKNLRLSKKRMNARKKHEIDDPAFLDDLPSMAIAVGAVPRTIPDFSIDKASVTSVKVSKGSARAKELALDHPDLDDENDQAIANGLDLEFSLHYETGSTNSSAKPSSTSISQQVTNQNAEPDERVRKLLELREKASALSARLSGLRNRVDNSKTGTVENDGLDLKANTTITVANDPLDIPIHDTERSGLVNSKIDHRSSEHESDQTAKQIEGDDNSSTSERRSEGAFSIGRDYPNDHNSTEGTDPVEITPSSIADKEHVPVSITNSLRVVQQHQSSIDAEDANGMYDGNADKDIDVREIGVYSIGVVWPLQHQEAVAPSERETQQTVSSPLGGSSSLSSSAGLSPQGSTTLSRRDEWPRDFDESNNESKRNHDNVFELTFYEKMKNKLQTTSALSAGEVDEATTPLYHEERQDETRKSDSGSDSESDLGSFRVHASHKKYLSADRGVMQGCGNSGKTSPPNEGLVRLIRETDDSLSVIDRVAKKLYHKQRERSEREKENLLQERIAAEKKELLEKDMVLKAVMATVTGKILDREDPEGEADVQPSDEEQDMESAQYSRLEEIMDEVEKERAREKHEGFRENELVTNTSEYENTRAPMSTRSQVLKATIDQRKRNPVSSSSVFWDDLVSETTGDEFDGYPERINFDRPQVEIDDSELVAQRESRLREDDDQKADSPSRVHSPRSLSRRLMAAVDYQEAIFDAHMKLSMMEHARELESVQAESITLAQAFKEEMEHNATSHQLALDHATLEQKFDGDMQDVMQQLDTIRREEEQERNVTELRMQQELRLANLRECSMQTETSQRADAATSAVLYVDMSTSPIQCVVDVAVQHDTADHKPEISTSAVGANHELEDASEVDNGTYDETFEEESRVQVELPNRDKRSTSGVPSSVESLEDSPSQRENDDESEIQSVLSGQGGADNFEESGVAKSIVDEESFPGENSVVSSVESIVNDEVYESNSKVVEETKGGVSVSMDYDDDFEVSSPKLRAMDNAVGEDNIEDELVVSASNASEDIEEQVDRGNENLTAGEELVSDDVERSPYSSQFEDTSRGVSSPKLRAGDNQMQAIGKDDVEDELVASASNESSEMSEDLAEQADGESESVKTEGDMVSEDVESNHYSSQFDETSRSGLMKPVIKDIVKVVHGLEISTVQTQTRNERGSTPTPITADDLKLNAMQTSEGAAAAYILDLDRRKQAEESLLNLRLQTVEQKFQHEVQLLENTPRRAKLDTQAVNELEARKDNLKVAFLAEKAIVESLKAASTARFYQDLHTFRSLSLDWPRSVGRENECDIYRPGYLKTSVLAANASSPGYPVQVETTVPVDDNKTSSAHRDEYSDEFETNPENGHSNEEMRNSGDVEITESDSVVSEHSEVHDDIASEPSDVMQDESEYAEDFASISESTPHPAAPTASSSTMRTDIEEKESEKSVHENSTDKISSRSEVVENEAYLHASAEEVHGGGITGDEVRVNDASENSSESEIVEDEPVSHRSAEEIPSDEIAEDVPAAHPSAEEVCNIEITEEQVVPRASKDVVAPARSVMSKLFGKNAIDRSAEVDEGYDVEYEAESFEEEQNGESENDKADKQLPEVTSYEVDEVEENAPGDSHQNDEEDADDSNYEVASEVSTQQSEIGEEGVVDEESDHIDDEHETIGHKADSENDENNYENDYENESFDEGQPASGELSGHGQEDASLIDETPAEGTTKDEVTFEEPGYDGEDAYSDEAFDSGSESFINEAPPVSSTVISPITPNATTIAEAVASIEEDSVKCEELTEAAAQLEDATPVCPMIPAQRYSDPAVELSINESKSLAASVSASLSHDQEGGSLTKSIEERNRQLQALKQQIEDRKKEIFAVQKQMRVERRREQLVSEEKISWEEMEHVERLLHADETALVLCQQRNRLEITYLDAKRFEHSIGGKAHNIVYEQENNLLLDFDYIEEAQVKEQLYISNVSQLSRQSHTTRGYDLLEGYAYVEPAEPIDPNEFAPTVHVSAASVAFANPKGSSRDEIEDDAEAYDKTTRSGSLGGENKQDNGSQEDDESSVIDGEETAIATQRTDIIAPDHSDKLQESDDECFRMVTDDENAQPHEADMMEKYLPDSRGKQEAVIQSETGVHQSSELDISEEPSFFKLRQEFPQDDIDLLTGYDYVEVAETTSPIQTEQLNVDLLVDFDYVEIIEPVEMTHLTCTANEELRQDGENVDNSDVNREQPGVGDNDHVNENKPSMQSVDRQPTGESFGVDLLVGIPAARDEESPTKMTETTINDDARSGDSFENSIEDDEAAQVIDILDPNNAVNTAISGPTSSSEVHEPQASRKEEIIDRVAALLYAALFQELQEDIRTAINYRIGDVPNKENIKNLMEEVTANMGTVDNDDNAPVEHEHKEMVRDPNVDRVLQSERVTDTIFAAVFDEILDSELQIWSSRSPPDKLSRTIGPQTATKRSIISNITASSAVKMIHESTKCAPKQDPRARDHALTKVIVDQLEIVDGEIRLPVFSALEVGNDSTIAYVLYDTIEDLARECFRAINVSASGKYVTDEPSMLTAIRRHVQSEVGELLAIRAQSEHELERQLQLISDESGAEARITSDVLLSQNCVPSNVSNIISKVRTDLSWTTDELPTESQPTRSTLLPRTPISRAKTTSILSSLQTQQDQELQQRITGLILNDLLRDTGLC